MLESFEIVWMVPHSEALCSEGWLAQAYPVVSYSEDWLAPAYLVISYSENWLALTHS